MGRNVSTIAPALVASLSLAGCAMGDRLAEVGRPPAMTQISDVRAGMNPDRIAYPVEVEAPLKPTSNSLWRMGSKTFLKDQRAARVGDVVTVTIDIDESATLDNETALSRSNSDSLNLGNLAGYAGEIASIMPGNPGFNPAAVLGSDGESEFSGSGSAARSEAISLRIAAVVVDRLSNGNFVISGHQEVRVNNELRDVRVGGIIRPSDIDPENAIAYDKIAEARISYGGRGNITDQQQQPIGSQIVEIVRPF